MFDSGSVYKLLVAWQLLRRVDEDVIQLDRVVRVEPDDAREPEPAGLCTRWAPSSCAESPNSP